MSKSSFRVASTSLALSATLLAASPTSAQPSETAIVIGETIELESRILDETRQLTIGTPNRYDESEARFPVLYLLDGPSHFNYATGIVNFLAANQRIPPMIVVGIANTDRSRDLSPPTEQQAEIERSPTHGGADNFLRYLDEELVPWVDENYRTLPHRVLVGHSLGGLFAVHTLVSGSTLFDSYIAISPSMWWNDQRLVTEAEIFFESTPKLDGRLYMTAGNEGGALLGGTRKLAGILDEMAPQGFEWQFDWMADESHGSVPLPSLHQGLQFVFSDYYLADPVAMFDDRGLDGLKAYFARSGDRLGIERPVPMGSLIPLLNGMIRGERWDEMAMLIEQEPETYSPQIDDELFKQAWTYLARGYASDGNEARAIEYYRKLVEQDPDNEVAAKELSELEVALAE